MALWANTRRATGGDLRRWLTRAGLSSQVTWVVTSVDAGARKPAPQFFEYALREMAVTAEEVLFVGNQRNTDIAGGEAFGIRTVWLSDAAYRSADDAPCDATPSFTIPSLKQLPRLIAQLNDPRTPNTEIRSWNRT